MYSPLVVMLPPLAAATAQVIGWDGERCAAACSCRLCPAATIAGSGVRVRPMNGPPELASGKVLVNRVAENLTRVRLRIASW